MLGLTASSGLRIFNRLGSCALKSSCGFCTLLIDKEANDSLEILCSVLRRNLAAAPHVTRLCAIIPHPRVLLPSQSMVLCSVEHRYSGPAAMCCSSQVLALSSPEGSSKCMPAASHRMFLGALTVDRDAPETRAGGVCGELRAFRCGLELRGSLQREATFLLSAHSCILIEEMN